MFGIHLIFSVLTGRAFSFWNFGVMGVECAPQVRTFCTTEGFFFLGVLYSVVNVHDAEYYFYPEILTARGSEVHAHNCALRFWFLVLGFGGKKPWNFVSQTCK